MLVIVAGCSKGAEDKINAARNAPDAEQPAKYCELAKDVGTDAVKDHLAYRFKQLGELDVDPDAPLRADIECIARALAGAKAPPDIGAPITRLHFKHLGSAVLTAPYEALPADQKKAHVLDAFAEVGTGAGWARSAPVAAPALLAEIDKLGGADDPRFFTGLAGALARFPDRTAPAIKERYAKVAADPRIAAAWIENLRAIDKRDDDAKLQPYVPFMKVAIPELAARNVTLDAFSDARAVLKVCGLPDAGCPDPSRLNEQSKTNLRYCHQRNGAYDWAPRARAFVVRLDGAGPASGELGLLLAELRDARQRSGGAGAPATRTIAHDDLGFASTETIDKLVALGPSVAPELLALFEQSGELVVAGAAARALAKLDGATLATKVRERLARQNDHLAAGGSLIDDPALSAGMYALADAQHDAATPVFLAALSSLDPATSGYATAVLQKRLDRDAAIAGLFAFMSQKDEYAQYEIDNYVGLVTSYGAEASAPLVASLDELLAAAGSPAKVFWAHKVVAMTALQKIGTAAAIPVVKKYAGDPGAYLTFATPKEGEKTRPEDRRDTVQVPFEELVDKTVKAIALR